MGIWDKEREAYAERQRQRLASLYSKYKFMPKESAEEREQKVQLFIDDFLIPKFKELIKSKPYSNRLTISFRCDFSSFNASFYSTASPFELNYYDGLWRESEYDPHLILLDISLPFLIGIIGVMKFQKYRKYQLSLSLPLRII